MSERGSRAESRSSWAVIRLAIGSSTSAPRTMIRWWSSCIDSWSSRAAGMGESVIHPAWAAPRRLGSVSATGRFADSVCRAADIAWRAGSRSATMATMAGQQYPDMWVDPEDDPRSQEAVLGDERATLLDYLHSYRLTLELKCSGLTADQLATRSVPPSTLSLLGLVRHLAAVERNW